jgi:hypothetical protein
MEMTAREWTIGDAATGVPEDDVSDSQNPDLVISVQHQGQSDEMTMAKSSN